MHRSTSSGCNPGPKIRQSSIHDITSVHDGYSQGPIISQHSVPASVPEILGKHQPPAGNPQIPSVPAIGHPVPGSHALGTPVGPLPPNSVPPHMACRMPAPVPNMIVPVSGGCLRKSDGKCLSRESNGRCLPRKSSGKKRVQRIKK